MRDYGVIQTAYWTDDKIAALSTPAKLLGAYLLSCPHSNAIGCFRLPMGYICEDLRWDPETVRRALDELAGIRFICRDEMSGWTLIRNYLAFNGVENPNVGKACMRLADMVPGTFPYMERLIAALEPYEYRLANGYLDGLRKRVAKCRAAEHGSGGNGSGSLGGNGSAMPESNGSGTVRKPFRNRSDTVVGAVSEPPSSGHFQAGAALPGAKPAVAASSAESPANPPLRNPFETVPKPFRNPEPEPEPEPKLSVASATAPKPALFGSLGSSAEEAEPTPSAVAWGPGLDSLAQLTGRKPASLRSMLGGWCRDYGEAVVVETISSAVVRQPALVAPIPWIIEALKARKADGHGKPSREDRNAAIYEPLARAARRRMEARSSGDGGGGGPAAGGYH